MPSDALLGRADTALGFDWLGWFRWLKAHPLVHVMLAKAYASIPLQMLVPLVGLCSANTTCVDELVLATILSVAIIMPGVFLLPAVGAWWQNGLGIVEPWRADILALRSHTLLTVGATQGIVAFPSFRAALGILLTNVARGRRWSFWPVLVLNLVLVASVMSEGAHYAVDMISGVVVSFVAIAASRSLLARCARTRVLLALPQRADAEAMRAVRTARRSHLVLRVGEATASGPAAVGLAAKAGK